MSKDTTELDNNKDNLKNFTLAEYLEQLLQEKNLSKSEVIKKNFDE